MQEKPVSEFNSQNMGRLDKRKKRGVLKNFEEHLATDASINEKQKKPTLCWVKKTHPI